MGRVIRRLFVAIVLVAVVVSAFGCKPKPAAAPKPKLAPPAIATAGVLRVGVDLSQPPFAGVDKGRTAGIDIDVASAIAGKLNLKATFVNVTPSEVASALADGKIDMAMSVSVDDVDLNRVSTAGSYMNDGPVFFAARESSGAVIPTMTLETMPTSGIAAQTGSLAYWTLTSELDTESVVAFDTLREALDSVAAGNQKVAAGDALVGAYIARDIHNLGYAGSLLPATPLSVGVSADNTKLADAVRDILDGLDADGVLKSVRRKWVGDFPALPSADATNSIQ